MSNLWYEEPAKEWEEALPLGNGRIGAMVYGGVQQECIQVNEESMWFGGPVNRGNPDAKKNLPEIRQLLEEGKISVAEKLMELSLSGCPESMHCYQTLGEINLMFDELDSLEQLQQYQRSLSLEEAIAKTSFRLGDELVQREVFVSKPADCMVMRLTSTKEHGISFRARLRRGRWFDGVKKAGTDAIVLYGNLGRGGYEFAMSLKAKAIGGTVETIGETLTVQKASEVLLYFTADTTYHYTTKEIEAWIENREEASIDCVHLTEEIEGFVKDEFCKQQKVQAFLWEKIEKRLAKIQEKPYEALKREHIQDHQELYQRVVLRLEQDDEKMEIPTDRRIELIKEGSTDIGLQKLLFDYGRYLTIACSRKDGLPATLQGLWNREFFPPWDSKYTININTEMNYWHVESCNLSECHEPLFHLIEKMVRNGRKTAREMYGCRGFVAHHNTDIHGDTDPQDIWYPGTYWTFGAAWLCTHLWMHYRYTLDQKFLYRAFPLLTEAALFFVDFLIEKDGYLVTSPSVSPENTYILPNGEKGACCIGATMDNQILRDLFEGCLGAYQALGKEAQKAFEEAQVPDVDSLQELMEKIQNCAQRLMPDRISKSGRILEWMEDYEEEEPGHRHISHLYGLFPAEQITPDRTPELSKAASKTLEYRLSHGGGHTGWSRAWIMNHYATLWDGDKLYDNIEKMLAMSTYPNMFDRHPPFQIDGNFGACAAITRAFVQSSRGRVLLLPALPKAWKTGELKGIRLEGNAEIGMKWRDGKLLEVVIKADSDYHTTLIYQGKAKNIDIKASNEETISF